MKIYTNFFFYISIIYSSCDYFLVKGDYSVTPSIWETNQQTNTPVSPTLWPVVMWPSQDDILLCYLLWMSVCYTPFILVFYCHHLWNKKTKHGHSSDVGWNHTATTKSVCSLTSAENKSVEKASGLHLSRSRIALIPTHPQPFVMFS